MSNPEIRYSLSKSESKLFSSLVKLGGQTKQELLLTSSLNIEKADEALLTLINKVLENLAKMFVYAYIHY